MTPIIYICGYAGRASAVERRIEWNWSAFGRQVETAELSAGSNGDRRISLPLRDSPFRSGELVFEASPW